MQQSNQTLQNNSSLIQKQIELQKCVELSKDIIDGKENVAMIEMSLNLQNTFSKPTIRTVFKGENGFIGFGVVKVLVIRFIDSFGFSTKMNDSQIETLTVDTLDRFSYESLEDIILFFKMARNGQLGSTHRGVDSNLIYGEWFPLYLEKKAEQREINYQKEKSLQFSKNMSIEDVKKSYEKEKGKKSFFVDKVIAYIEKITEGIDREQLEILIEEWMKDEEKKRYIYHLNKKRLTIKK